MQHTKENPAVVGGASDDVRFDSLNESEVTTSGLPEQHRKALYMRFYLTGVIGADMLSWAFARNPGWRAA